MAPRRCLSIKWLIGKKKMMDSRFAGKHSLHNIPHDPPNTVWSVSIGTISLAENKSPEERSS